MLLLCYVNEKIRKKKCKACIKRGDLTVVQLVGSEDLSR